MYKYNPIDLEGPAIRLVRLLKGNFTDGILCELFDAWLHQAEGGIPYEALSYTWGSTEKTAKITMNGFTMGVTENLYVALQHLRLDDSDRILWVDAICINQEHIQERGHQVQQMRDIYREAEQVVIWLGQGTTESDLVMDSMKQLHENVVKVEGDWRRSAELWMHPWPVIQPTRGDVHTYQNARQLEGLEALLRRPWFGRIWILQEIANARVATVVCGKKTVSARTFALVPSLLNIKPDRHCQAVLDIMPGFSRKESWWSQKRNLHTLLAKFRESEATDPRDAIYALLGISSDACDIDFLRPDYTKTLQQVIRDTTSFLLSYSNQGNSLHDLPDWELPEFLQNLDSLSNAVFKWALKIGHEATLELMLERDDVDVNLKDENGVTPLLWAIAKGHESMVRLLLERDDVDVNLKDENGATPLSWAIAKGHESVVRLLLERDDVDVNLKDENGVTLLSWAIAKGPESVVGLLLARNGNGASNALQAASAEGHDKVVDPNPNPKIIELLLRYVANVNAQGGEYGNALQAASAGGHDKIIELLLRNGANVNAQGGEYGNALQAAAAGGHEKIIELLLRNGANVNAQGGEYGDALQAAAAGGHEKIIELLLSNGANVNAQGGEYGNALQAASAGGHDKIVEILLSNGADVNVQGKEYNNALYRASVGGHREIVKLLLNNNTDINTQDEIHSNALYTASIRGHDKVVELLLSKGTNINAQGGVYGNALQAASLRGHKKVVELLLSKGADVNAEGGLYGNAIYAASIRGHDEVVELLLSVSMGAP